MKIVNAVWEKRNIGCETTEVTFEQDDSLAEAEKLAKKLGTEYIVLKIPSYRTDIMLTVQKYGYTYIEDMVYLVHYLGEVQRNRIEQRIYDAVSYELMNDDDILMLKEEIRCGLFESDRIYIDSHFSHEQAAQRYIYWIDDELGRGTEFYKYIYKNRTVGFFALKENTPGHFTSFLGGIYLDCRKGGIGVAVKVPELVKSRGGKSLSGFVSSNNLSQIKNLVKNGYIPEGVFHTFIKHNS